MSTELEELYNEARAAFDAMVALNKAMRQREFVKHEAHSSPCRFVYMFGSIHFDIGRGTGKTEWILSRVKPGDLIVTVNRDIQKTMRRELMRDGLGESVHVISIHDLHHRGFHGLKFNVAYIDEPAAMMEKTGMTKYELVSRLVSGYDQTLIFTGA